MTFTLLPIAAKKAAALASCISVLTGYPIPDHEMIWVKAPEEALIYAATQAKLPGAYGVEALYFPPGTVWHSGKITEYIYTHELTHHFQHHAGVNFTENRIFIERQAHCTAQFGPWCNKPIPGYCK